MKKQKIVFFILMLSTVFLFAQKNKTPNAETKAITKPQPLAKTSCDCKDAVPINIQKTSRYGLTLPPNGFGEVQEIKETSPYDKFAFEMEHNSAWYLLNINYDGDFVFEIIPNDTTNDYDFLLYKYTDSSFCKDIIKHKIKPVRSNLSRVNLEIRGHTGLALSAKDEFKGKGIGNAYSKSISIKKGERYMLVLDNVYPEGKGHTIFFNYVKEVEFSGVVLNDDSVPQKAEVTLNDNMGKLVKQVQTDDFGKYGFKTEMKENTKYTVSYTSDDGFSDIKTINTTDLAKDKNAFTDIRTVLPKLKKGKKYKMSSINFYGDQAVLIPESMPSVDALCMLMKKNKKMVIRIEGHVNAWGDKNSFDQVLSENRAKTVFNYLIKNGIEKERMSTIGYGSKYMLFPHPHSGEEQQANRRVEINVISID